MFERKTEFSAFAACSLTARYPHMPASRKNIAAVIATDRRPGASGAG